MKPVMVDLITSMKVEKVPKLSGRDYVEYITHGGFPANSSRVTASDHVLLTERFYTHIVPITQICFANGRPDMYVAYSKEVEKLIGVPVRAIKERVQAAEDSAAINATNFNILLDTARELVGLGFLDRLRFLLGLYRLKHKPPKGVVLNIHLR